MQFVSKYISFNKNNFSNSISLKNNTLQNRIFLKKLLLYFS